MLISIFGKMGSGKTLLMSMFGQYFKIQDLPVYSNYELKDTLPVQSTKELGSIENGVICLDEFWLSADSRLWKDNVFMSRWIMMTRKKNLLVFYTTQNFGQIDIRIRSATDLLIFCEHLLKKKLFRFSFLSANTKTILKSFKIPEDKAQNFYNFYDSFKCISPLLKTIRSKVNTPQFYD